MYGVSNSLAMLLCSRSLHGLHKLSDTGAVVKKSGQSLGPFLAKTDDDSLTISMFFISFNTDDYYDKIAIISKLLEEKENPIYLEERR